MGLLPVGEYDDGDPAADSIMEPSDDARAPEVLEVDIPGKSWRGRADALAARHGDDVVAGAASDAEPSTVGDLAGDLFAACCKGEDAPMGLVTGESLKPEAPPADLGLADADLPYPESPEYG